MTRQPSSFLIRIERTGEGTITSIRSGERAVFATVPDIVRVIERLLSEDRSSQTEEEKDT